MAKPSQNAARLAKYLTYVLGCRPDEFGLVADPRGFVAVKDLIKALREEDGWRHLREANVKEVLYAITPCPVEVEGKHIRARHRERLPRIEIPRQLPKLLYTAIRSRAYPRAVEKGLTAGSRPHLILSSQKDMALRLGRRIDNAPVVLTVNVMQSMDAGTDYKQYGEDLYLAGGIAAGTFSGPALPRERTTANKPGKPQPPPRNPSPGSYFPDIATAPGTGPMTGREKAKRRRKGEQWKRDRRQERRHKRRQQGS